MPAHRSLVAATAAAAGCLTWIAAPAPAQAATTLTHSQATTQLRAAGIAWDSPGDCATQTDPTCTSFTGVRQSTIDGVVTLRRASGCAITVTGGTEVGHSTSTTYSHINGWKLDLRLNSCIAGYVDRSFAYQGLRGDGWPLWKAKSGNLYCKEGTHWDVLFYTSGG